MEEEEYELEFEAEEVGEEPLFSLTYSDIVALRGYLSSGGLALAFALTAYVAYRALAGGGKRVEGAPARPRRRKVKTDDDDDDDDHEAGFDTEDALRDRARGEAAALARGVDGLEDEPDDGTPRATLTCIPFNSPSARVSGALALNGHTGDVIMYGGLGEEGLLGDEQLYSFRELDWVEITPPKCEAHPGPRAHHALAWLGDCVALLGGVCELRRGYASSTRAEVYDDELYLLHLASGEWLSPDLGAGGAAPKPDARAGHTLSVWGGRYLVVFGGRAADRERRGATALLRDAWLLDLEAFAPGADAPAMRWLALDDARACAAYAPPPRDGHAAVAIGDRLLVFGGADAANCGPIVPPGELEVLDFAAAGELVEEDGGVVAGPAWALRPTAGESPALDAGVAAHAVGERGHVVLLSNKSAGLFNAPHVLDAASTPMQWSGLKLDWHGDWTMIPGCRESHFSCADAERGALYIFGGESANGMVHNTMLVLDVSDALGIEPLADDAEEEEEEEEEEVEADRER